MTYLKKSLIILLTFSALFGCEFISNSLTYEKTTRSFVESVLNEDYESASNQMALEHEGFKHISADSLKKDLIGFREIIIQNFGTELEYKFMIARKSFSTMEGQGTAPNTALAQVQFSNSKEFGVFEITFDDFTNKIINIRTLDIKEPIPNMLPFWLFGLFAICIPIFNIYVIRKVYKSSLRKKWLKYLAIIIFNTPSITYNALSGLSFKLIQFQLLLGIGFKHMGYLNSIWSIGIPLGGIYWLWKLKQKEKSTDQQPTEHLEEE